MIKNELLEYLSKRTNQMVAELSKMIELESPSTNKKAVDSLGAYLASRTKELGASVEIFRQKRAGDHILASWGEGDNGILMLCHMDTVWDLGEVKKRPVRIENGRIFGPGAEDMKGGITVGLWALQALKELDIFPEVPVKILFTSDEETGSEHSRELIETIASRQKAAFVLEPAQPPLGSIKTSRKGVGEFEIEVKGRAAHAGADHQKGINAIDEMAFQIIQIRSLTDYAKGTTVNVGMIEGGTRSNVVPASALIKVDVRVTDMDEAARIQDSLNHLKLKLDGTSISVKGGFDRPPMERSDKMISLFNQAKNLAKTIGFELTEAAAGGASDGNFIAALGIPVLDGLGVVGEGGHSTDEFAETQSLPERAALLAMMLYTFDHETPQRENLKQ